MIKIAANAATAKLHGHPSAVKRQVTELLSFKVEGSERSDAFKRGYWDGTVSLFNGQDDTFPAGFLNLVYHTLTNAGYAIEIVRYPLPAPLGPVEPKIDDFGYDPRYDYQPETVRRLLIHGQMIAQIATGGGKSRIARLAYATIQRNTLFITTRSVLMYQMKRAFEQGGVQVGVMGDGEWAPCQGMNVAMVQTLASYCEEKTVKGEMERWARARVESEQSALVKLEDSLKKKKVYGASRRAELDAMRTQLQAQRPPETEILAQIAEKVRVHNIRRAQVLSLLHQVEFVIGEEAHESSGDGYYEVLRHCKNAYYRLALTATPFMRGDEANMRLMAGFGPIGIKVSEKTLIDREILARPYFKYVSTPSPDAIRYSAGWQDAYKKGIVQNTHRNQQIVYEVSRAAHMGVTSMVLVQQKEHGQRLLSLLMERGVRAEYIRGESAQDERQTALRRLGSGQIDVLIGTTILDVGVDVPAVGMIVLAGGGKAEVALRQRIGRGLRAKKKGPNIALIVDFTDTCNEYLQQHAHQRREVVLSTEGFAENVLPDGADFNFQDLGLEV